MDDYEQTTTVSAGPDALFRYLSDVHNLPSYFAAMKSAEPAGGDAVHTVAEVDGTEREGDAWFTTEDDTRKIRWGAPGPSQYSGELQVTEDPDGSRVTVRLHTEHGGGQQITDGLAETLAQIKRNVEAGADPDAPEPTGATPPA